MSDSVSLSIAHRFIAALALPVIRRSVGAVVVAATLAAPQAAKNILDARTGDGWEQPFPEYIAPGLPGYYKPTPPGNLHPTFGTIPT